MYLSFRMSISLSGFGFIGIVDRDLQSLKGVTSIGRFTTIRMIKYFFIIGLIAALVPTAISSVSVSADEEIGLFSKAPFDSDDGDSTSESFSPSSQSEQTDEVNTFESDEAKEGTSAVFIDPASSDYLTILSQRISTDEILDEPTMDINGEIQNNGIQSIDFVKVTATFYDQSNSILGSDFTYTRPTTLEPGQSAPFKVTAGFGDELPVDEIASIKLHVNGRGDFDTGSEDLGTHGVSGKVHPSDLVSVGGDVNSETSSETSSPSSPEQQTEGDNKIGSEGNRSQSQKTQDQIWEEQRESITMGCLVTNPFKEFNEVIGEPTEEVDEDLETCNHDMLYLLGLCEQNNDGYGFCKPANSYVDENNLEQISERPMQMSQETIEKINEFDWNEDGVTDGSDFVSKPST
jgi:hypothetical protein